MSKARKKRKRAFESPSTPSPRPAAAMQDSYYDSEVVGGVFGFFRDFGVRETIESIVIAIILALLFRTYEAEAFIIPTGSMAPTLQGQHMDINCEKCGLRYRTGATDENSTVPSEFQDPVSHTHCPICNYEMRMRRNGPKKQLDHNSNNGDRILVNKFIYDFSEPQRFDVIVFKNPNNGKQNYIKRLIGLPGERLLIENGDIYTIDDNNRRQIVRKPEDKVRVLLQLVDDTHHIPEEMEQANWPLRWNQWAQATKAWSTQKENGNPEYFLAPTDSMNWLTYRHLRPEVEDWADFENGDQNLSPRRLLGQLITDYYAYNDAIQSRKGAAGAVPGAHWVGDLALEAELQVNSDSGIAAFRLVEGGTEFVCRIDVATGEARIECENDKVTFEDRDGEPVDTPTATTRMKGKGKYKILFANLDDKLYMWINNRLVPFDASAFTRDELPVPKWSTSNAGDAEPLGVGGQEIDMVVKRLKVKRDIYYTSAGGTDRLSDTEIRSENSISFHTLYKYYKDPTSWSSDEAIHYFTLGKQQTDPMFYLEDDQFLPMGDNSPQSQDGRIWSGERYLHRDYMLGRAMLIYWPHTFNYPIPYFTPNFKDMGFIR